MNSEIKLPMAGSFEKAIAATGFGKFNYILLLLALYSTWASMFVTTNMAFIIPAAQCDLGLSLLDMGMLNASPFVGMILSAFFWGYLADTSGRKQILIYGFIADSICNLIGVFSINIWMLATCKFLSGFIVGGPFAALMSYLSEFHAAKYRSKIIIATGVYTGTVNMVLPLLAWLIMPMSDFSVVGYKMHSWQLYILICAMPSMISGLSYLMMPESPKFLMTIGKHEEALKVLKKMYAINNNKTEDSFQFTELTGNFNDISLKSINEDKSNLEAIKKGWKQIKPLFYPPFLWSILLVIMLQFCTLLGSNTLRLWLPQLFTAMDEYEQYYGYNNTASICDMINYSVNKSTISEINTNIEENCITVNSNAQVYINSAIVGVCSVSMYGLAALVINIVNKKIFLAFVYISAGFSGISLIWATSSVMVLCLSSLYTSLAGVAVVTTISIVCELFPTTLRTMTVSLTMMTGRSGTILGNVIFPILLMSGCVPPFLLIGGVLIVCIVPLSILSSAKKEEEF